MDTDINSANWDDKGLESTEEPTILMIAEEVPTLPVASILGVTIVILIAIVFVFTLGVLIDWRQQRLLDKKIGEAKRRKNVVKKTISLDGDAISIANNMEEPDLTVPPAEALKHIP